MATSLNKLKLVRVIGLALLAAFLCGLWAVYPVLALKRVFHAEPGSLLAGFLESVVFPAGNPSGVARGRVEYTVKSDADYSSYFKHATFRTPLQPEELQSRYDTYLKPQGYILAEVRSQPNWFQARFNNSETGWMCSVTVWLQAGENMVLVSHMPSRWGH